MQGQCVVTSGEFELTTAELGEPISKAIGGEKIVLTGQLTFQPALGTNAQDRREVHVGGDIGGYEEPGVPQFSGYRRPGLLVDVSDDDARAGFQIGRRHDR